MDLGCNSLSNYMGLSQDLGSDVVAYSCSHKLLPFCCSCLTAVLCKTHWFATNSPLYFCIKMLHDLDKVPGFPVGGQNICLHNGK